MSKRSSLLKSGIIAIVLATLLMLCACSAPAADDSKGVETGLLDPKNPVTVTLWHYYAGENQQALERAVSDFNQTEGIEKGIIVDAVAKGSISELEAEVTDSAKGVINAEPMPDIFSSYPDKAFEIDQLGLVCDLSNYFTDAEKEKYVPDFFADGVFDNRFLLVPIVKSTELTYVNDTEWSAFKQDQNSTDEALSTWEGIYDTARAYYQWTDAQTPDTLWDGKAFMGYDSVANYIIIANKQMGVDVIDAEKKQVILDESALTKMFDIYCNGMALGYFDEVGKFRSDDIKAGDLTSYVGSSSGAAYFPTWIEEGNSRTEIDFLPLVYPTFEGGDSYAIQQGAGMCVSVSEPQKQEGAVLFLKWFTDVEQNIDFAMTTGYLPVQTEAYESESFETALNTLRQGEANQKNVASVYEIALHQITEANTYAVKPFEGSYDVRRLMQETLIESGEKAKEEAASLKQQGLSEEEILAQLDTKARFGEWLDQLKQGLDQLEISYM